MRWGAPRFADSAVTWFDLTAVEALAEGSQDRCFDSQCRGYGFTISRSRLLVLKPLLPLMLSALGGSLVLIAQRKLDLNRDARVIFCFIRGHMYTQPLLLERLNQFKDGYDGVKHYALTKRAQVSLAEAFTERYANTQLIAVAMHPGWSIHQPCGEQCQHSGALLSPFYEHQIRAPTLSFGYRLLNLSTSMIRDISFLTARRWMSICRREQGRCHSPTTHSGTQWRRYLVSISLRDSLLLLCRSIKTDLSVSEGLMYLEEDFV